MKNAYFAEEYQRIFISSLANNPNFKKTIEFLSKKRFPLSKGQTIQKVLISANGAEQSLIDQHYFDRIITLNDLMDPHYWPH